MSVQVRRRREAAAFLQSFVGAQGELLVDTTNNRVQVHDGVTPGGWPAAKLAEMVQRTAIADAGYAAKPTDRTIVITALSAARTITLPGSATFPPGATLTIVDESGACSPQLVVTIAAAGTDVVNGLAGWSLTSAYGYVALESNGTGKWTVVDSAAAALTSQLVVNISGTPLPVPTIASIYAVANGADQIVIDSYGMASAPNAALVFRAARGTAAAPTAVQAADALATFGGRGYGATGFPVSTNAAISFKATQAFTDTAQGATITFNVTPNNTNNKVEAGRFDQSGFLGIGTTTPQAPVDVVGPIRPGQYTVATLPAAGIVGRLAYATNARMFNGTGTLEASGQGSGGLVTDNGSAWKIAGTNVTASA